MILHAAPTLFFPALLDLVVTPRIVSLTSYVEVSAERFAGLSRAVTANQSRDAAPPFEGEVVPGQLPPTVTGAYHVRLPGSRLDRTLVSGASFGPAYENKWFQGRSYALLDLDDPTLRAAEKADAAVWVCGLDYEGCLRPFYNAISQTVATKMHPMRSTRTLGSPACLAIYQPFADIPLTQCSMTLRFNPRLRFVSNLDGWEIARADRVLDDITSALPQIRLIAGGGQIAPQSSSTVTVEIANASGETLDRDTTLFLEETGGYLPLKRITARHGRATFKVMSTGLDLGERFKIKVGFRTYTGLLDVPFEVA